VDNDDTSYHQLAKPSRCPHPSALGLNTAHLLLVTKVQHKSTWGVASGKKPSAERGSWDHGTADPGCSAPAVEKENSGGRRGHLLSVHLSQHPAGTAIVGLCRPSGSLLPCGLFSSVVLPAFRLQFGSCCRPLWSVKPDTTLLLFSNTLIPIDHWEDKLVNPQPLQSLGNTFF
jgi:hypothetical protein